MTNLEKYNEAFTTVFSVSAKDLNDEFNAGNIATATQYTGDRQDMVQHANRHQIKIEAALLQILRAMLWVGKVLTGAPINENAAVTINFDDSYISDAETRRQRDKDDALNGFVPKYVYNMEWRGMSEEDARACIVSGFADNVSKELPLEYALEMNNLIRLEMKGSIG